MNNYENGVKLEEVAHWRMTTKMKCLFIASHPVLPWSWFWFLFEQLVMWLHLFAKCIYWCHFCEHLCKTSTTIWPRPSINVFMWQLKLLQENIANLERSINKSANPDQLEMLESLSHHVMRCSDITVKRALQIQSATGESYKGKLGLQQLTMVWMWKKVNELKDVLYCSLLLDAVYIYTVYTLGLILRHCNNIGFISSSIAYAI